MKPRAVLLSIVLSAVAACSLGGGMVTLGSGHPSPLAAAGTTDTGGGGGSGDEVAGNGAAGSLNVGDAGNTPMPCAPGKKTTVSGTVYDPAGQTPLYNAVVYIPKGDVPLPVFTDAVACETCPYNVKATDDALSGPDGSFVLNDVPPVNQIDLVVQLGKWRRLKHVAITPCMDNPLDKKVTRLPKDHTDGDGIADLPKIALSTGHSDALECLLRKIGISDSEFTTDSGTGRVNMFVGCVDDNGDRFGTNQFAASGQKFPSTNQLFDTPGELSTFDMVIFSCEGHKCDKDNGIGTAIQTTGHISQLVDFANRGGRVLLDHDHYNWLNHSNVPIEKAAQFSSMTPDGGIPDPLTAKIVTDGFPKGQNFAQWLLNVHASTTLGTLGIHTARTSVESLTFRAQSWIYSDDPIGYFYFTIGTPVADKDDDPTPTACGRVVFTDLHVSSTDGGEGTGDVSDQDKPFPSGCVSPMPKITPQELALEFMIFDLSSCVQKETDQPMPPPVVK